MNTWLHLLPIIGRSHKWWCSKIQAHRAMWGAGHRQTSQTYRSAGPDCPQCVETRGSCNKLATAQGLHHLSGPGLQQHKPKGRFHTKSHTVLAREYMMALHRLTRDHPFSKTVGEPSPEGRQFKAAPHHQPGHNGCTNASDGQSPIIIFYKFE